MEPLAPWVCCLLSSSQSGSLWEEKRVRYGVRPSRAKRCLLPLPSHEFLLRFGTRRAF